MSEDPIKIEVRRRDGGRCTDCGLTSAESIARSGRNLAVHRLIPRSNYSVEGCVTLCRQCHAKAHRALRAASVRKIGHVERVRIPKEPLPTVTCRLERETIEAIDRQARHLCVSRMTVVRRAILAAVKKFERGQS